MRSPARSSRRRAADAVLVIAGAELRAALRGRLLQGFAALFAVLAIGISLAGLGASGQVLVQGFVRTATSLLTLSLYLLPLLGLVVGAYTFGSEDGGTEMLLVQPVSRLTVLLGRALGLAAALGGVAVVGFGIAGGVVGGFAGRDGLAAYLTVALGTTAVGWAALAAGILIGVVARRRPAAIGAALAAWLCAAVLYDLLAIALLQFTGSGEPGAYLVTLLAMNPVDGIRALGLVTLGADVLLGPTGAAMQQALGPGGGAVLILGSLGAWCVLPVALAAWLYGRRDF
ncbi:MAG TPA: ABC transporter permease subunit [Gemmatimonadales bacterium]|jgi:Cu-processing system permease protein|nr:ABC transporter permease subunit [Gemmatimonadales bacterium]